MKPIKIYGESKTGTTYLQHLLEKNTDAKIIEGNDWSRLGWKHGFPVAGYALYIFIFRDVYETAKSLIADPIDKRFNGLEAKFGDCSEDHWKPWNSWLECRKAKYYSYIGFSKFHTSILVNCGALRKDPMELIGLIRCWGTSTKETLDNFEYLTSHAYRDTESRDNPDRKPLTAPQKQYIDENIDPELEAFVNNLTIK